MGTETENKREKIDLTSSQHQCLCNEEYYDDGVNEVSFTLIEEQHESTGRHQEYYSKVLKRNTDGKYFEVHYSTSIKDSMDWRECNDNFSPHYAEEVFPIEKMTTHYV